MNRHLSANLQLGKTLREKKWSQKLILGAKSPDICWTLKTQYHRKPEVQQGWGMSWLLPKWGTQFSAQAVHPHSCTQLLFLHTPPPCSEQLNHLTLRTVWSQTPRCKPGHVPPTVWQSDKGNVKSDLPQRGVQCSLATWFSLKSFILNLVTPDFIR